VLLAGPLISKTENDSTGRIQIDQLGAILTPGPRIFCSANPAGFAIQDTLRKAGIWRENRPGHFLGP